MQKHLIISILLAFSLVAMSAPAVTLVRRNCIKRSPSLSKSSASGTSHAPSKPQPHKIGRRAPGDTSLCGISLRSHSASACQGNPGFVEVKDKNGIKVVWKAWGEFSSSGSECDHLVELQLVKAALESTKFCEAWNGILHVAATEKHVQLSAADQSAAFNILKNAANPPTGLHYLAKDLNGEKEHFVADVIRNGHAVQMTLAINSHVVEYIKHLGSIGDTIAANIDHAAYAALHDLYTKATATHKDGTSQDEKDVYACSLMTQIEKATGFEDKITAVSKYWGFVRGST